MHGTVHLVRHGAVHNPNGVFYGRLPGYRLSARGQREAQAVAEKLSTRPIYAVWASPLERAQETAAAIAERHGVPVVTDERLTERASAYEGRPRGLRAVLALAFGEVRLASLLRSVGNEPIRDVSQRMVDVIRDALLASDGREIVMVSHRTPLLVARYAFTRGQTPRWWGLSRCATGSLTTLVMMGQKAQAVSYSVPRRMRLRWPHESRWSHRSAGAGMDNTGRI